ncbi:GGDEF domain-containing protein [Tardiphaga alba]|uniref:GGDEF domain-containing protein n=1 Tax=Tardiphaga alba TaxID=340268 RepID=A0ABX8A8I1_9BRAD|nr:GGDEF domain-containing protein [Tardiphaga alba]QUS40051.1 GGDEF domain-containing protein [Tardiphaga alba]
MSDQATIVAISNQQPAPFATALAESNIFPVVDATWADALDAVARVQPAAVVASATAEDMPAFEKLTARLGARQPYIPLIAIDPVTALPGHAIPLTGDRGQFERLSARLRNALRIRTLHATVLRRLTADNLHSFTTNAPDPLDDATVMLVGRSGSHAALSVALGAHVSLVGALSIEAAAKHLNARDLDGIVIGDGFTPRVIDAFLTVLTEDPRFRSLPVIVTAPGLAQSYDLANFEMVTGEADDVTRIALPLVRQRAFEARLNRTLRSIDSEGLIDAATGLLTLQAFERDLATAVYHTQTRGGGLSAARFTFKDISLRAQRDAARIISRLMRKIDFGTLCEDGSIIVMFAETDPRNAHMIARRLSAVMKHTMHGPKRDARNDPRVKVTGMNPDDTAKSLMERLQEQTSQRAAS